MNSKAKSFVKLLCTLYLIVLLPKFISNKNDSKKINNHNIEYVESIENLKKNTRTFSWLKKLNLALICDLDKKDQAQDIEKILYFQKEDFKIKKTFIIDNSDEKLFNKYPELKKIKTPVFKISSNQNIESLKELNDIEGIIFNVTNKGTKNDKCFNTLLNTMLYAEKTKKTVIVLDQPNPLAKFIEGPGEIPFQHGLTSAELARYFNNYILKKSANLTIIPMIGWMRENDQNISSRLYQENLLSFLNQIKPINSNLDKKLSTQAILLPQNSLTAWETEKFKNICKQLGLFCTNYSFFNKQTNTMLNGLKITPENNLRKFSAFNAMLSLTRYLKNRKNLTLEYSDNLNTILGSSDIKDFFQNKITFEKFQNNTNNNLENFYSKTKNILLYKPSPQLNKINLLKI